MSDSELSVMLSSAPPFPGVRFHIVTDSATLDEIETVHISFPVNIHSIDRKNSRIMTYDEIVLSKGKNDRSPTVRELRIDFNNNNNNSNSMNEFEIEEEFDMIAIPVSGCHSIQGERSHMEDRFVNFEKFHQLFIPLKAHSKRVSFFGVYDGHAGARVADFCTEELHKIIANELINRKEGENISEVLERGLIKADEEIVKLSQGVWKDGSCVSIVMIFDSVLYSVNLGDSHMVLCEKRKNEQNLRAIVLSRPHIASNEEEKKRIISLGGMVAKGRIFGDLMVSRALGDLDYKQPKQEENYVSNIPHKEKRILNSKIHPFFIIASDGLWEKLTSEEAVNIVDKYIKEYKDPTEISKILVDEVMKRGGLDNTTAMVVFLHWVPSDQLDEEDLDDDDDSDDNSNNNNNEPKMHHIEIDDEE